MTTFTTKQLALKMQVTSGTAIDWGRKLCWPKRPDPYSSGGFLWEVTLEQIEEFKQIKARSVYLTIQQRREMMGDMLDLWDRAFFGRVFPRSEKQVDMKGWKVSYTHIAQDEEEKAPSKIRLRADKDAPPCKKDGCENKRFKRTPTSYNAYCRAHHNELNREAGRKYREKLRAQKNAQKLTCTNIQHEHVNNCKEVLTSNILSV